jgi:serine/threonine-protein kinase RsbW
MTAMRNTMRLELVSAPESVAVVRSKLRQLGASSGLEAQLVDDLLTAVSEACNNVVLHAYRGRPGTLRVDVVVGDDVVDIEVSDSGSGIAEVDAESEDERLAGQNSLGLGVALIQALAQRVVFADRPGNGTAVSMSFTRLPLGLDPHASSAAHGSGLRLHTNGKPRSSTSSHGRHRVRASGRVSPDSGSASLGWRTQAV